MQGRRRGVWIGLVAIVLLGAGIWWWQSRTKGTEGADAGNNRSNATASEAKKEAVKLTMEVVSMSITDIKGDEIKAVNTVIIKNPLPVALNATRYEYATLINGVKVSEGVYNKPIHLPASGSETITLPIEIMIKPLADVTKAVAVKGKDSATYTFLNTIHTDVPIVGERKFQLDLKEELPIAQLPKMKPGDLDVKKLGLKNSGMDMTMHITNPNSFTLRMEDGRYTMTIDGKTTTEGVLQEVVTLPAKKTVPVAMHLEMKTGQALKTGWKMLFDKKDTRYELTFDGKILSDSKLLKNANMHVREEGMLQDLKEVIKKE